LKKAEFQFTVIVVQAGDKVHDSFGGRSPAKPPRDGPVQLASARPGETVAMAQALEEAGIMERLPG
jgi:hypothetical protein